MQGAMSGSGGGGQREGGAALPGSMQHWPLTIPRLLDYAEKWHGDQEVCCR